MELYEVFYIYGNTMDIKKKTVEFALDFLKVRKVKQVPQKWFIDTMSLFWLMMWSKNLMVRLMGTEIYDVQ